MSEEDGYDILYRKYIGGSALVKKYRQKITALRTENERLKDELSAIAEAHKQVMSEQCAPDEKHCTCVPILRQENERLRADKRELVEACEKAKFLIESPATSFMDSIRKRAMNTLEGINAVVAKHKEE